jgi:hypothetical protein
MSGHGFHVHGPHDHELEHAQQGGHGGDHGSHGNTGGMINQIAMFTAIIATVGALFGYMGGPTQACTRTTPPSRKPKPLTSGITFRAKAPNSPWPKCRAT